MIVDLMLQILLMVYHKDQSWILYCLVYVPMVLKMSVITLNLFADDTTIYFNYEDFTSEMREAEFNTELQKKLNEWQQLNKLTLNIKYSQAYDI